MSLREQISNDIKTAMKEKNMEKLNALRMVQSAFKNREIELRPAAMPEEECITVIKKLVKQRQESIEQFTAAKRQDLVDAETKELALLNTYLPAQLTREQIEKIVADVIAETGANSVKVGQSADNRLMSEIIKSKLQ